MNESMLSGKWKEIKGEMLKTWGELTHDDLDRTHGNMNSLIGLLQQKFGIAKEEASQRLGDLVAQFEQKGEAKKSEIADRANDTIDTAKDQLRH